MHRLCAVSAPSTPDSTAAMQADCRSQGNRRWMGPGSLGSASLGGGHQLALHDSLWSPASAPVTLPRHLHQHSAADPLLEICECTDYGRPSWSLPAHMLDAIQAHLSNPFLRPITVRCAAVTLHATQLSTASGHCTALRSTAPGQC